MIAVFQIGAIVSFLAMTPPPPPPIPAETTYPLPQYRADCRLVDREGKLIKARIDVSGVGETRKLHIVLKSSKFPELRNKIIYTGSSIRVLGKGKWESVMDAQIFKPGKDPEYVWIEVGSDLTKGAHFRVTRNSETVPLATGLCTAKPFAS
jgi:hypothetical protein